VPHSRRSCARPAISTHDEVPAAPRQNLVQFNSRRKMACLVSPEEKIDTGSAASELIFHLFGAIPHINRKRTGPCGLRTCPWVSLLFTMPRLPV
jgi:hypothetical protein